MNLLKRTLTLIKSSFLILICSCNSNQAPFEVKADQNTIYLAKQYYGNHTRYPDTLRLYRDSTYIRTLVYKEELIKQKGRWIYDEEDKSVLFFKFCHLIPKFKGHEVDTIGAMTSVKYYLDKLDFGINYLSYDTIR